MEGDEGVVYGDVKVSVGREHSRFGVGTVVLWSCRLKATAGWRYKYRGARHPLRRRVRDGYVSSGSSIDFL